MIDKRARQKLATKQFLRRQYLLLEAARIAVLAASLYFQRYYFKDRRITAPGSGLAWVLDMLHGHPSRMFDNLSIKPKVFTKLLAALRQYGLKDRTFITGIEMLAIFLYRAAADLSFRKLAERFQRGIATIHL
jgi:hypothetical protein